MATGNMLQGQARGSVGDITFQVIKGQQVARVRNRKPANPRTWAMMAQRVTIAAPTIFYRRTQNYFTFAFNRKKTNQSFFNAYMSANIKIAPYLNKKDVEDGNIVPAPWYMTDGDLTPTKVVSSGVVGADGSTALQIDTILPNEVKWADVRKALGANIGDMWTLGVWQCEAVFDSQKAYHYIYQHIFDKATDEDLASDDYIKITGSGNIANAQESTIEIHSGCLDPTLKGYGACVVLSRNDKQVLVSSSQLTLNELANKCYEDFRDPSTLEEAIYSYGTVTEAILDPKSATGTEIVRKDVTGVETNVGQIIIQASTTNVTFKANVVPIDAANKKLTITPREPNKWTSVNVEWNNEEQVYILNAVRPATAFSGVYDVFDVVTDEGGFKEIVSVVEDVLLNEKGEQKKSSKKYQ